MGYMLLLPLLFFLLATYNTQKNHAMLLPDDAPKATVQRHKRFSGATLQHIVIETVMATKTFKKACLTTRAYLKVSVAPATELCEALIKTIITLMQREKDQHALEMSLTDAKIEHTVKEESEFELYDKKSARNHFARMLNELHTGLATAQQYHHAIPYEFNLIIDEIKNQIVAIRQYFWLPEPEEIA